MQQTVQHGGGQGGVIAKHLGPLFVGLIGGDDGGARFLALAEDLEEQVGARFINRQLA